MLELLIERFHDPRFMTMVLAAIAVSATAYTLITPFFVADGLTKRMKAVASERERIRQRERERLSKSEKVSLRQAPKQIVSKIVEDLNLGKWVAQDAAREKLVMAGYRGQGPYVTFLFFRMVTPIVMLAGAVTYVFLLSHMQHSTPIKIGICIGAAFLGLQAPMLFLKNDIATRQLSPKRALPDARATPASRCGRRSGGTMKTRNPPPPAPETLPDNAPADSASPQIRLISALVMLDAVRFLASQLRPSVALNAHRSL